MCLNEGMSQEWHWEPKSHKVDATAGHICSNAQVPGFVLVSTQRRRADNQGPYFIGRLTGRKQLS